MAELTITPRGYTATAAELLDASADDREGLAVRQLAATQAIGYALLALGDQLADLTDTATDLGGQLGDVSDHVADISESLERHRLARLPGRFMAALEVLRACGGAR